MHDSHCGLCSDVPDNGTNGDAPGLHHRYIDLCGALQQAHDLLDAGDSVAARDLAQGVLASAERIQDRKAAANALMCLANCDRQVSRFRSAQESSQRSAMLFRVLGDPAGEAAALTTFSHASAILGRYEEAVEAALLSAGLTDALSLHPQRALSYNYLGIAYFISSEFEKADAAFVQSAFIARQCEPPLSPFQPLLNRAWGEVIRLATERFHSGLIPGTGKLQGLVDHFLQTKDRQALHAGVDVSSKALCMLVDGFLDCWNGRYEQALRKADDAREWVGKYGVATMLSCLETWLRAELRWAAGDLEAAGQLVVKFIELSVQLEYERFAALGHMFASQLYVLQGKPEAALDELRKLRRREEGVRTESLESRTRAVAWQMEMRAVEGERQRLELSARNFERLALEDPLTGIGNRRWFERRLDALISRGDVGQDVCVALLDVDSFKQVNDSYSHFVGDEVLKAIATILKTHVREIDAPARLGGDEFVVAFACSFVVAAAICERVREAVECHEWSSVAGGLRVSVSIGLTQAQAHDTVATLLSSSDTSMYGVKATRSRHDLTAELRQGLGAGAEDCGEELAKAGST